MLTILRPFDGPRGRRRALSLLVNIAQTRFIKLPNPSSFDQRFFIKCDTVIDLLRSGNRMVAVPPPPKRSSLTPVSDDPPELNAALTECR
jgi:hypothetical protein